MRKRPMDRITIPLREMGARVYGRQGGRFAPLSIEGGGIRGIWYRPKVASAQVKSCILLAGLGASGRTCVEEPSNPGITPKECSGTSAQTYHQTAWLPQ